MVKLYDQDIQNKDVVKWSGVHLFHFNMSSCSQKLRIYLKLKGINWTPHEVNLSNQENCQNWFLEINPRGLVPVLVLDGDVHIESNDIIKVLEQRFPDPDLIPADINEDVFKLLDLEDALHLDLRRLSFRFVYGRSRSTKTRECLDAYASGGSGTVQGKIDAHKMIEMEFYQQLDHDGLQDVACRNSAQKFKSTFDDLDKRLENNRFLTGKEISVADIAWFVTIYRLHLAAYPLSRLHPRLNKWFEDLHQREDFATEVRAPQALMKKLKDTRQHQLEQSTTLSDIAGF